MMMMMMMMMMPVMQLPIRGQNGVVCSVWLRLILPPNSPRTILLCPDFAANFLLFGQAGSEARRSNVLGIGWLFTMLPPSSGGHKGVMIVPL